VLGDEIKKEFPELREYVDEIIENTGGERQQRGVKHEGREAN
jgi:hypothetical protein